MNVKMMIFQDDIDDSKQHLNENLNATLFM